MGFDDDTGCAQQTEYGENAAACQNCSFIIVIITAVYGCKRKLTISPLIQEKEEEILSFPTQLHYCHHPPSLLDQVILLSSHVFDAKWTSMSFQHQCSNASRYSCGNHVGDFDAVHCANLLEKRNKHERKMKGRPTFFSSVFHFLIQNRWWNGRV
mmetsp:Transcript_14058/g.19608  ORF Transcript_14058/g.19608 Transcript_14058/m.19608 type:complete len:155 (+) Transcript_14058:68-532(+)